MGHQSDSVLIQRGATVVTGRSQKLNQDPVQPLHGSAVGGATSDVDNSAKAAAARVSIGVAVEPSRKAQGQLQEALAPANESAGREKAELAAPHSAVGEPLHHNQSLAVLERLGRALDQMLRPIEELLARSPPLCQGCEGGLSLLQSGVRSRQLNPILLLIPLLGLGALALVVVVLFFRFERELNVASAEAASSASRDPYCRRAEAMLRRDGSSHSLSTPLPSLRSFELPPASAPSPRQRRGSCCRAASTPRQCLSREPSALQLPMQEEMEQHLCPALVVPKGMELIFAVQEVLKRERQQLSFSVLSLQGQPLSHVIVNERGRQSCGIQLQMLDQRPLATVDTKAVFESPSGAPAVHRPSGEIFCTVAKVPALERGQHAYSLKKPSGQPMFTIQGDFTKKKIRVIDDRGQLVCDTEKCDTNFDSSPHYQVRVAPGIDAGLILCGLMAAEKLGG